MLHGLSAEGNLFSTWESSQAGARLEGAKLVVGLKGNQRKTKILMGSHLPKLVQDGMSGWISFGAVAKPQAGNKSEHEFGFGHFG